MLKLFDFECYWFKGQEDEVLRGQFLLNEEGWFEGAVSNIFHGKKTGESFIYGEFSEDKGTEFLRISSQEGVPPFLLTGLKTAEGYEGESYMLLPICGEIAKIACTTFFATAEDVEAIGSKDRDVAGENPALLAKVDALKTCSQYRDLYRRNVEYRDCKRNTPKEDAGPRISLNNEPK